MNDVQLLYAMEYDPLFFNRSLIFKSERFGPISCSNIVTYFLCHQLSQNPKVESIYNSIHRFKYFDPYKKHPMRKLFALDVVLSGRKQLLYVCSVWDLYKKTEDYIIEAAESYAQHTGLEFRLITEPDVFGKNPEYMKSLVEYFLDRDRQPS